MTTILLLALFTVMSTGGLVLLSYTLRGEEVAGIGDAAALLARPKVLAGAALYIGSFGCWLLILTRETVSTAFPLSIALTYTATIAASATILDEPISRAKYAGIACVAIGAVVIGASAP